MRCTPRDMMASQPVRSPEMSTYRPPKQRLHKEFLYLNHDTVLNSLSALEAGKVDEIIQKVVEAREGGVEGSVGAGPVRGGAGKKKKASIEEELVKTRTWFSAFDAWHAHLTGAQALGTFDVWDIDVRNALSVGDTLEFTAELVLSPVHKVLRTFLSYADNAAKPGHVFSQKGAELAETKQMARIMVDWMGGRDKPTHLPMYMRPGGVLEPRIVAGLQDAYLIGGHENIEGTFTVVGQVTALLSGDQVESTIRIIRDVPPTQAEVDVISEAMTNFIEPALEFGVEIDASDINIPAPAVMLRPIAIYQ
jgi:hypothetical protein